MKYKYKNIYMLSKRQKKKKETNHVPSWLPNHRWPHGNSCTWAYYVRLL